jgi:hypothetical protein
MSNYQIGAFEALEWAWYVLSKFRNEPAGVDEARHAIKEILTNMGRGHDVDFSEKILEAQTA